MNIVCGNVNLTRSMLEGRELVAGLGLPEFMLILFGAPTSGTVLNRRPPPVLITLLGLEAFFAGATTGFGGGGGCSMIVRALGLRNMPVPESQSK